MGGVVRRLGAMVVNGVWQLGFAARFFWLILVYSGQSFTRLHLTIRELYFSGVLSLLIILVSGLFVGLVLGLQGYEILQRYGSTDAMGTMVALSLLRELGPVVAGLLFASRAGSAVTAEIGLMKVTEQQGDGHDGRQPHRPGRRAALLGRGDLDAAARRAVLGDGHLRRLADWRGLHRSR